MEQLADFYIESEDAKSLTYQLPSLLLIKSKIILNS